MQAAEKSNNNRWTREYEEAYFCELKSWFQSLAKFICRIRSLFINYYFIISPATWNSWFNQLGWVTQFESAVRLSLILWVILKWNAPGISFISVFEKVNQHKQDISLNRQKLLLNPCLSVEIGHVQMLEFVISTRIFSKLNVMDMN